MGPSVLALPSTCSYIPGTIHGKRDGVNISCVFVLFQSKSEDTYEAVLRKIAEIEPQLEPRIVITDFEKAAMNAFIAVFGSQIHGCHFYFGKCIWRKVQELGFAANYRNDGNFSLYIHMLVAITYIPIPDKVRVYEQLIALDVDQMSAHYYPILKIRLLEFDVEEEEPALFSHQKFGTATRQFAMKHRELTTPLKHGTVPFQPMFEWRIQPLSN